MVLLLVVQLMFLEMHVLTGSWALLVSTLISPILFKLILSSTPRHLTHHEDDDKVTCAATEEASQPATDTLQCLSEHVYLTWHRNCYLVSLVSVAWFCDWLLVLIFTVLCVAMRFKWVLLIVMLRCC